MAIPLINRRRVMIGAGLAAIGVAGIGLYTWRIEPHWVELVSRDLPITNLPAALHHKTLIQISDLHVGPVVDLDYMRATLQWVSSLAADIVVVTGDFMTCQGAEQVDNAARMMQHLKPGRLGCFAVLGNHDYGSNWRHSDVAAQLVSRISDSGIRVLRNEAINVAGLQLVGIDDFWATNFHPEQVVRHVNWSAPALTLCHNPDAVDRPSMADVRGWILSGHTHGGQCKPPFLPPPLLPVQNKRYTSGAFELGKDQWLYINRGLGYLKRVRFNVRPEVTMFRLCSA